MPRVPVARSGTPTSSAGSRSRPCRARTAARSPGGSGVCPPRRRDRHPPFSSADLMTQAWHRRSCDGAHPLRRADRNDKYVHAGREGNTAASRRPKQPGPRVTSSCAVVTGVGLFSGSTVFGRTDRATATPRNARQGRRRTAVMPGDDTPGDSTEPTRPTNHPDALSVTSKRSAAVSAALPKERWR